ncbi:MAG: hypothetical protein ABI831_27300, partial [Betaproteobacteria bacterium]
MLSFDDDFVTPVQPPSGRHAPEASSQLGVHEAGTSYAAMEAMVALSAAGMVAGLGIDLRGDPSANLVHDL